MSTQLSKVTSTDFILMVNHRVVSCASLKRAIQTVYANTCSDAKYFIILVNFLLPADLSMQSLTTRSRRPAAITKPFLLLPRCISLPPLGALHCNTTASPCCEIICGMLQIAIFQKSRSASVPAIIIKTISILFDNVQRLEGPSWNIGTHYDYVNTGAPNRDKLAQWRIHSHASPMARH